MTVPRSLNGRKDARKPIDADTYYEEMLKQVEREKSQLREALQQVQDSQAPQLPVAGLLVSAGLSLGIAVSLFIDRLCALLSSAVGRCCPQRGGRRARKPCRVV